MIKKAILCLALLNLGIQNQLQASQRHSNSAYYNQQDCEIIETGAKVALVSIVIASCTYALYKIGSWLFTKTDEQIFQEAFIAYHQTKKEYKKLREVWMQEIAYQTDEHFLASLPLDGASTIYNLGRSLEALEEHKKKIEERLIAFKNGKKLNSLLESRMKKLRDNIKVLHKSLKPIHSFLAKHSDYYQLVQELHTIKKTYYKEITALEQNRFDEQTIHKLLTSHIMSNAENNRYPYIHYIENLSNRLKELMQTMDSCKHSYPKVERTAQQLKEYLECIHSLILIHNAYHLELQERERNRLKEEKIALEKAKVKAQQDQARALEKQNWLRTQEIYNQEKILRKLDNSNSCKY